MFISAVKLGILTWGWMGFLALLYWLHFTALFVLLVMVDAAWWRSNFALLDWIHWKPSVHCSDLLSDFCLRFLFDPVPVEFFGCMCPTQHMCTIFCPFKSWNLFWVSGFQQVKFWCFPNRAGQILFTTTHTLLSCILSLIRRESSSLILASDTFFSDHFYKNTSCSF